MFDSLLNSIKEGNTIVLWGVDMAFDSSLQELCHISYDALYNHYLHFIDLVRSGAFNYEFEDKCLDDLFRIDNDREVDKSIYKGPRLSEIYLLPNGCFMFTIESIYFDDALYGETWFFDHELSYIGSTHCYGIDAFSEFIKSNKYRKTRNIITLDEKIEKAQEAVEKAKSRYDAAIKDLRDLLEMKKQQQ